MFVKIYFAKNATNIKANQLNNDFLNNKTFFSFAFAFKRERMTLILQ